LIERRKSLGSSDAAAVLGISPFSTPLQVYLSKIDETELIEAPPETDNQRWGHRLEGPIADEFQDRNSVAVIRPPENSLYRAPLDMVHATPDRMIAERGILEIKAPARTAHHWEAGVPLYVQVQVQHQLLVMGGCEIAWVAALLPGHEYRQWTVEIDPGFQEALDEALRKFWWKVENRQPPSPSSASDHDAVRRMFKRATNKVVLLPKNLIEVRDAWMQAKETKLAAEKSEKIAAAALMYAMGSATVGALPDGSGIKWANEPRNEAARKARTLEVRVLRPLTPKGLIASGYEPSGAAALPAGDDVGEVQPRPEEVPGSGEGNDLPAGGDGRGTDRLPDGGESVQP
jgi:putative phage-type endonuclease